MYVYRYIDTVFCLWLVAFLCRLFGLLSVCFPACVMLSRRALLFAVIWCTRVTMRYNRFSVLGSVVLPCALSCDCSAFYKCLLRVWLMVGWFARLVSYCAPLVLMWLVLVCAVAFCWREDGAYWL